MRDVSVLMAAPTHECKRYALFPYLRGVSNIMRLFILGKPADIDFLLVDNSPTEEYALEMREICNELHIGRAEIIYLPELRQDEDGEEERIQVSRQYIKEKILEKKYDYWFSLESDVVCEPEGLKFLLWMADKYGFSVVRHSYPSRTSKTDLIDAMGCALYDKKVLEDMNWTTGSKNYVGGDYGFWDWALKKGFRCCNLFNVFQTEHIGE